MTYLLFAGSEYYPTGPDDFKGGYRSLESAHREGQRRMKQPRSALDRAEWFTIFDGEDGKRIATAGQWYGMDSVFKEDLPHQEPS